MIGFKVPALPQSVNSLYRINFQHKCIFLSNEGRAFKNMVKNYMPPCIFDKDTKFHLNAEFHGKWTYKNEKNKKADIQNLTKVLIDAIFERLQVDDSWLYSFCCQKVEDDKTFTYVVLKEVDLD